jgi:murein DD-endopeptidase MepM/ murein hydrolase activator NlpD
VESEPSEHRHISLEISLPGRDRPIALSVAPVWAWMAGVLLLALLSAGVVAVVTYVEAMNRLKDYTSLEVEVEALRRQNAAVKELEQELSQLRELQRQMLHLAGIQPALGVSDSLAENLPGGEDANGALGPGSGDVLVFWPLEGKILKDYGPEHPGVDIGAPRKRPIVAAGDGVVTFSGRDKTLGNRLVLDHADSLRTIYADNELNLVAVGDSVEAGQVIALVGAGPEGAKPHLHFEVWKAGKPVPPREAIPELFPND